MNRTTIVFGPPGTGKTTVLLRQVERALQSGVDPTRIGYFAFTRKAAQEAITRAMALFNLTEDDFPWFRTLHSTAFAMLGLSSAEVMTTEHLKDLGKALGPYTFTATYNETVERPPQGGALGDRALGVYSLARAMQTDVETAWRMIPDPRITLYEALRFARAIDEYKAAMGLLDFNDFLDEAASDLDLDLMIIDEAQDLTRQQWAFARRLGMNVPRVLIAGDDDQAIFRWAGADLRTFLSLRGNLHVLPQSYRLPQTIWAMVVNLARRIKTRRPKEFLARQDDPGRVIHLTHPDQAPISDGSSWLLLARHIGQLSELVTLCRNHGVVYQHNGRWSNQAASVRAVLYYERLRRGDTVTQSQAQVIARFLPNMTLPMGGSAHIAWDDIPWPFDGRPVWMDALIGLGHDESEYIRALRRRGQSLADPGRVIISTIHGVKGGEADRVLVLPDVNYRVLSGMIRNPDDETRVWYVALSRARQTLYLVTPRSPRFFKLTG